MTDREAMQMALEALEEGVYQEHPLAQRAITALRAAIAAAEQLDLAKVGEMGVWGDPVAYMNKYGACKSSVFRDAEDGAKEEYTMPLYTHSQREWQGLTDEEWIELWDKTVKYAPSMTRVEDFARAIEAKLKEKNHG